MAAATNLTVRISAVDATSDAIDAVARRLSGMAAPATKVTKSLARLSDATGVTRLSKAIVHLGGSAVRTSEKFVGALGPLGALTAALSVGGFAKMTSDWARMSQALSFDAARIGVGVSQLHALEGSARLSGTSAEAAASGIRNLQDVMTDTVGGRNMEALVYFRQLGVAFDDGAGHALRATTVLPKLADAIAKIKDPSIQARVATQFFGGAAESMLPWLRLGSAGMAEYAEMARRYGVQTEASAVAAGVFRQAQTRLSLAFEGLGNSISEKVSPPISRLMVWLAELVNRYRPQIAATFGEWAERLERFGKSIDWDGIGTKIKSIAESVAAITASLASGEMGAAWRKFMEMLGFGDNGVNVTSDGKIAMPRPSGVESEAPPLTPGQHTDRGKLMMGILEGKGWSHDDSAAIIAGLDRESGLRTGAVGDNGLAYGAAQWHPDRQGQFNDWSKAGGTNDGRDIRHSSMEDQTNFINWDLTKGKYKSVGDRMRAAKTLEEKMGIFDRDYESPADKEGAIRSDIPRARQWASQDAVKPGTPPAGEQVATKPGTPPAGEQVATKPGTPPAGEQVATKPGTPPAGEPPAPRAPSWSDNLQDGPFKRWIQGPTKATPSQQEPTRLAPGPEEPLPRPVAANSKVDVHVRLSGLPAGATAHTTTSGDAASGVRIERAMP